MEYNDMQNYVDQSCLGRHFKGHRQDNGAFASGIIRIVNPFWFQIETNDGQLVAVDTKGGEFLDSRWADYAGQAHCE